MIRDMDFKKKLGTVIAGVTLAAVIAGGAWIGIGVAQGAQAAQARTTAQHAKVLYAAAVHTRVLAQSVDIKAANDAAVAKAALATKLAAAKVAHAAAMKAAAARAAAAKAAQQAADQAAAQQTTQTVTRQAATAPSAPSYGPPPVPSNSHKLPKGAPIPFLTDPNPQDTGGGLWDTSACISGAGSTINGAHVCD